MKEALSADLAAVRDLALQAGRMLLDSMGKIKSIEQKTATEFVTDVDRRVEDMLIAGLNQRFPGDSILAEESGNNPGNKERTWYVDPLDGTTNYAHGYPFFSVSIAAGDASGLRLGAVFAPYLDELYLAEAGKGALMERPLHGISRSLDRREPVTMEQALLATGFPYLRDEWPAASSTVTGSGVCGPGIPLPEPLSPGKPEPWSLIFPVAKFPFPPRTSWRPHPDCIRKCWKSCCRP